MAIFSSEDFDATELDVSTIELAGAPVARRGKKAKYMAHVEDVNWDGLPDLVVQVETMSIDPDRFIGGCAPLTAQTLDGQRVAGMDAIRIVPPH